MVNQSNSHEVPWEKDAGAIVFISGASRPRSDKTIYERANAHQISRKVLSLPDTDVAAAHVVYGRGVDVIAVVSTASVSERIRVCGEIRGLRNSFKDAFDFVSRAPSMPIISMFGRPPDRNRWKERKNYCAWMFAESSEDRPAETFANYLISHTLNITFVATLAGEYDVGMFIEADERSEFDNFIDRDMPMLNTISRSDTFILPSTNIM